MNRAKKQSSSKHKGCMWWLARGIATILLLAVVLAIYQTIASRNDRAVYPPPGDLIEVGGQTLHLNCSGSGSPTVILESGMITNWLLWDLVQSDISTFTRVCSYDRPGMGWSEPADGPSTTAEVAIRLHQLLEAAGEPAPYVLVGHSIGGVHIRSFTSQYPDEVVGLVLVDSAHEQQNLRAPEELAADQGTPSIIWTACRALAPFGLQRFIGLADAEAELTPLSAEKRQQFIALANQTHFCKAAQQEEMGLADLSQTTPLKSLGDLPLVVLSADKGAWTAEADDLPEGITIELLEEDYAVWIEMHQELAALSTQGRHQIVTGASHFIQYDAPQSVIDAVREVVEASQK